MIGVDHGHSRIIGEFPEIVRRAADADLDCPFGVEDAVEHRLPERTTMVELRAFVDPAGIAMGVKVDHADGLVAAQGAQNRIGDGMIAADGERDHPGVLDQIEIALDIGMAGFQAETAAERYVTDIGDLAIGTRHHPQRMLVGTNPLDTAHGARTQARTSTVGDAKIHGHADQGNVQPAEIRQARRIRSVGRGEEGGGVGKWQDSFAALAELGLRHAAEFGVEELATLIFEILVAEPAEFRILGHGVALSLRTITESTVARFGVGCNPLHVQSWMATRGTGVSLSAAVALEDCPPIASLSGEIRDETRYFAAQVVTGLSKSIARGSVAPPMTGSGGISRPEDDGQKMGSIDE